MYKIKLSILFFLLVICHSAYGNSLLNEKQSLVSIIQNYRNIYFDVTKTNDELIAFFGKEITYEYTQAVEDGERFLGSGLLSRVLDAPVIIRKISDIGEVACDNPKFYGSDVKCLFMSGNDKFNQPRNLSFTFRYELEKWKIVFVEFNKRGSK